MSQFLNPMALWGLAVALPAITALYFLKLRRQEQVVSSTLLWKRSVYDLRVNAPIQMIKRNLLLLLQLLIASLIIVGLARPFTELMRAQGRRAALVIDCSASMGTRDVNGRTRLEAAKEEALKLIDRLGVQGAGARAEDELCVIAAADRPVPVCGLTADKDKLRRAVESIQLKQSATRMGAALEMAVAVTGVGRARREIEKGGTIEAEAKKAEGANEDLVGLDDKASLTKTSAIILSDGAFPPIRQHLADKLRGAVAEDTGAGVGAGSRFIRIGETTSDNLAIVSMDLRTDPLGTGGRQLFVRLENMGETPRSTALTARLDDRFLDSKDIEVPGRSKDRTGTGAVLRAPGQRGIVFDLPPDASGVLEVSIESQDSLPADDRASAVLEPPEPIRALLVTRENFYLEQALHADRHNLRYDRMTPEAYAKSDGPPTDDGESYEIILFDRFAPKEVPLGATCFIDAVPALPHIREDEEHSPLFTPMIVDWNQTHPLMRNLSLLDRLFIYECRKLELSGSWARVVDAQGLYAESLEALQDEARLAAAPEYEAPLVGCLISEERRVVVLAFDVLKTERWVMRVSFPLFFKNVTHWLARPGGLQQAVLRRTGETLRMRFSKDVTRVIVRTPSGAERSPPLAGKRNAYFSDTYETGLYRVRAPGEPEQVFAVNLLSSAESSNAARDTVTLGEEELSAAAGPAKGNQDLWPYLVLAALAFLLVEWYVYNHRILG